MKHQNAKLRSLSNVIFATIICTIVLSFCGCDMLSRSPHIEQTENVDTQTEVHYHSWSEWEITLEATCTQEGSMSSYCACGAVEATTIPLKSHKYTYSSNPPTCYSEGIETYTCQCGDSYSTVYSEIVDHVDYTYDTLCDYCGKNLTGLYDASNKLIASWEDLILKYGMDISKNYKDTYATDPTSPYYLLNYIADLSEGVKLLINTTEPLGEYVFANCTMLQVVVLGSKVTSISTGAFEGCTSLWEVRKSDCMTSIGDNAFRGCTKLEYMLFPEALTHIGNSAFENCTIFKSTVLLPNLEYLGDYAFANCHSLTYLSMPKSTVYIGKGAFKDCTKLTYLVYLGTISAWSKLDKDTEWDLDMPVIEIICSDGIINP